MRDRGVLSKVFSSLLLTLIALLLLSFPAAAGSPTEKEKAAISAAENFLLLVDTDRYPESWRRTAPIFRSQFPQEKWVEQLQTLRPLFGSKIKRELKSATYATSLLGAPDGEYVLLRFDSSFEKAEAVETVTMKLQPGQWQVAGYFIR